MHIRLQGDWINTYCTSATTSREKKENDLGCSISSPLHMVFLYSCSVWKIATVLVKFS